MRAQWLALLLVPFSLAAEPQEIASSLALEQTVDAALHDNAQLRSMRAKWEAMRERSVQATTLPNPMLMLKGQNAPEKIRGGTQEARVEIQQDFPWAGKLGLRGRVARKEAEAMQRDYEAMQREVIMMVKETYFDLYSVQRSLSITREDAEILDRMEKIATSKYEVGEVGQTDVLKAQTEISMLKQKLYELEQQESVLKAKLNQLLNRPTSSPVGLAVTEPQRALEFQADELFRLAGKMRPEIKKAQTDVERRRYERDLMKKEFFPDYKIGMEYGHMDAGYTDFSMQDNVVMLTFGIELPIWQTKYRAGAREAEKMIESSEAGLEAAQQQTTYDVQDAYFKLQTARKTFDLYKTALIPQAEARYQASEAGYRTGKVDFLDLLESQRFLLSARVMAAMAEGNVGMQLGRLERAVGTDLPKAEERK